MTNQQIEQKKRAEKQMAAAAEHRAKVRPAHTLSPKIRLRLKNTSVAD